MSSLIVPIRLIGPVVGPRVVSAAPRKLADRILRGAIVLAMLSLLSVLGLPLSAHGQNSSAYQAARSFLDSRQTASSVLGFVHFGADYKNHQFLRGTLVTDADGNQITGEMALIYRYYWEDDGVTDIAFFVNDEGKIVGTKLTYDNGVINQPYVLADLSIQLAGQMVINSDNSMSESDRQLARRLVAATDAQGLMNLWLRLQ